MLIRAYRTLLYRAGLPHVTDNLFDRLRLTAQRQPDLLDLLTPNTTCRAREGKPIFPRANARRSKPASMRQLGTSLPKRSSRTPKAANDVEVVILRSNSDRGLSRVLDRYLGLRSVDPVTAKGYRGKLGHLCDWLGHEPTVDELCDDLLEGFMAWRLKAAARSPATVNGDRAVLIALWNFAWRKRLVSEPRGDVQKYAVPKRLPVSWSTAEVSRLLVVCAEQTGRVGRIPAAVFWPSTGIDAVRHRPAHQCSLWVIDCGARLGQWLAASGLRSAKTRRRAGLPFARRHVDRAREVRGICARSRAPLRSAADLCRKAARQVSRDPATDGASL